MLLYGICYDERLKDYKFSYKFSLDKDKTKLRTSIYSEDLKYIIDLYHNEYLEMWVSIEDILWLRPGKRDTLLSRFIDVLCEVHKKIYVAPNFSQFAHWIIEKWVDCFDSEHIQYFNDYVERNYNLENVKLSISNNPIEIKRFDVSLMQLIPFVVNVGKNCYKIIIEPTLKTVDITKNETIVFKSHYNDRNHGVQRSIAICSLMAELET